MRDLQSDLIRILRISSEHVNRRAEDRKHEVQKVEIQVGAEEINTETIDISSSGAKVAGNFGDSGKIVSIKLSRQNTSRKATVLESNEKFTRLKFDPAVVGLN